MPERDGFSVVEALKVGPKPLFVFATAYDRYAVKAFEAHALDYLLKPFSRARFRDSLDRASNTSSNAPGQEPTTATQRHAEGMEFTSQKLALKSRGKIVFVAPTILTGLKLILITSAYMPGRKHTSCGTKISAFEEKLDPSSSCASTALSS